METKMNWKELMERQRQERTAFIQGLADKGLTRKQAAEALEVTQQHVGQMAKRLGVTFRDGRAPHTTHD